MIRIPLVIYSIILKLWIKILFLPAVPAGGEKNIPPSRNRKNCCRKIVLFPKALFLVINFRKIKLKIKIKIQFFYIIFIKTFKFSQQFSFIFQTREKLTHGLLNSFEKYAKIMHFLQFFKENFLKMFNKLCFSSKRAKN